MSGDLGTRRPHAPSIEQRTPGPLRRQSVLTQFLASQAAGQTADAITAVVLARVLLTANDEGLDAAALLHTLGAVAIPYAVVGPLSGVVADRWSRRRLLGGVHALRALATSTAIVAIQLEHRPLALVVAAVLLSLARLVYTLRAASLPAVTTNDELVNADARSLFVGMISVLVGASLGTLGSTTAPTPMLVLACGGQLLAAIGFVTLPRGLGGRTPGASASASQVICRLGRLIMSTPTRPAIILTSLHRALLGGLFLTFVMIAASDFGMAADAYLLALVVSGLGTFAGTITAPSVARLLGPRRLASVAFTGPGLVLLAAAASRWPPVVALAVSTSFFVFQNLRVSTDATVQAHIADDARARVFSVYDAAYNLSYFGGAAAAVALDAAAAPMTAVLAIGAADLVVGAGVTLGRVHIALPHPPHLEGTHGAPSHA